MRSRPRKSASKLFLLTVSFFSLAGCAGGGGSSGGSDNSSAPPPVTKTPKQLPPPDDDSSGTPNESSAPPPVTKTPEQLPPPDDDSSGTPNEESRPNLYSEPSYASKNSVSVLVGIADSGFRVTHESLAPYLVGTVNLAPPDDPNVTSSSWHGTPVASVVTTEPTSDTSLTRTTTDTGLLLAKVAEGDSSQAYAHVLDYSVGFLADEGARVINHSYSGRLEAPSATVSYLGEQSLDSVQKIITSNGGLGSVYTVAAGNDGRALSASNPIYQYQDIYERMLIVGASSGDTLAEYSSYPGANETWQTRFLTAPGETLVAVDEADNTYGVGRGTSFTAPQVAAYAAAIIETWPHLNAKEVTQLLLDTASKDSTLYQNNACGPNNNLNCGYFYLGQGEADLNQALQPQGELMMPSGSTVQEGGYSLTQSTAQLSGAYGDSLASSEALNDVAIFDELGRDYSVDLSRHVTQRNERDDTVRRHMKRIAMASREHRTESRGDSGRFSFMTRYNGYGETTAARLDVRFGNSYWSAYQYAGDEISPMSPFVEAGFMPMLSFQAGTPLTQDLGYISGIASRFAVDEDISLIASHWTGRTDDTSNTLDTDYQANRSDLAMAIGLTNDLSLTFGVGVTQEKNALLGAQGTAALSFGDSNRMNMGHAQLDYQLGEKFSVFTLYEQGQGEMAGDGLIQRIEDIRTEEMAMGLQWRVESQQAALTFRQPMRLDNANATLSVPVGRTLDGRVIREDRDVSLAASGQQRDIEFGYAVMPSESSQVQFNLLYSMQPGHDRKASDDLSTMLNYVYRF